MANHGNFFAILDGEEGEDLSSLLDRIEAEKKKKKVEEEMQQLRRDQSHSSAANSRPNSRSVSQNRGLTKLGEKEGHSLASGKNVDVTARQPNGNQQLRRGRSNSYQRENGYRRNNGPANGYHGDAYNGNYRNNNDNSQVARQANGYDNGNGDQNNNGRFNLYRREEERRGYGGRGSALGRGEVFQENQGTEKDEGEGKVYQPNGHFNGNESRQRNEGRNYGGRQPRNEGQNYGGDSISDGGNYRSGERSDGSVTSEGSKGQNAELEKNVQMSFWKRLEVMTDERREAFFKTKAEVAKENTFWARFQKKSAEERKAYCQEKVQEEEEEKKKMTLKEYEELLVEKRKAQAEALKMEERRVTIDKDLEKMQLIGKNKEENGLKKEGDKKKALDNKDEKVHKSLSINEFHGKYSTGVATMHNVREAVGGRKDARPVKKDALEIEIDDKRQFPALK